VGGGGHGEEPWLLYPPWVAQGTLRLPLPCVCSVVFGIYKQSRGLEPIPGSATLAALPPGKKLVTGCGAGGDASTPTSSPSHHWQNCRESPCIVRYTKTPTTHSLPPCPWLAPSHQDLDFEFFNRVGFPDFAGGKATMLVDEDYDSPFTMVKEPDNYAMEREAARDAAQARALAGALVSGGQGGAGGCGMGANQSGVGGSGRAWRTGRQQGSVCGPWHRCKVAV
jgi:hypothetical protein